MKDRAPRHQRIRQLDNDVVGLSRLVQLHAHRRQLGQTDREVVVGTGEVGIPAGPAVLASVTRVVGAAEVERTVEVFVLRPLRRRAPEAAASYPDLLREPGGAEERQ